MRRVLVVDDEERIRDVVEYALMQSGFSVTSVATGLEALDKLRHQHFDLVVLDVMLPDVDGLEVCRQLRATSSTPILFLSARSDEVDRIVGLELGGDDYLIKPFSPRELVARAKAVVRRFQAAEQEPAPAALLTHGPLSMDKERHEVTCGGRMLELTATEFAVLAALLERPGVVLSRSQLLAKAYDDDTHVTERTLDTHIRRIRGKFREVGWDPIATVHGVGYKAAQP